MAVTTNDIAPDLASIKRHQQATWATGDYAVVGTTLQIVGEQLCEALELRAGSAVLDVAAGNGNATLAAARRFCDVTSTDYVVSLLEAARNRAAAEGLRVRFEYADAEDLPYADASFDAVVSTFGVMFAPNHAVAASELLRVCRPGGRIGLATWTPDGFIGEVFKRVGRHVPPPAGVASPLLWGTSVHLERLFGHGVRSIRSQQRYFNFRYRSAAHWIETFRTYYGPINRAYAALDGERQRALTDDLAEVLARHNRSDDDTLLLPSAYLEVVAERA
ncbi:MAG TPA: methyltransferase domain-containing protein [Dokdonella sp.]|nr:methyltransferase domain-containing protein [Dokdonella sp.]